MKLKKKNLLILFLGVLVVTLTSFFIHLQPYVEVQAKTYFHELVITEIMESIKEIKIPEDFVIHKENTLSMNTQKLNEWIIEANLKLNEVMENEIKAKIPMGYFSGNVFFQSMGPELSTSFLMSKQIQSEYDIKTTSLGINNALIELIINVHCEGHVLLGFSVIDLTVSQRVPLAVEYVQGEVPQIFPY